jgi:thioredoxin reductase (NADPH)
MEKEKNMYDFIIIGAGPAGLSAAVYAARYKMNAIVIGTNPGGYVSNAHLVDNWLGEKNIPGPELAQKFVDHVKSFDIEIVQENVQTVVKNKEGFIVSTDKKEFAGKRILIATGSERNKLNVKGEDAFYGKGVSYCATCDAFFFKNKTVAVVGGGDSAATAALCLADVANKVYLIHRRDELRAAPSWQDKLKENPKIELILNKQVVEISGENTVKKVILQDGKELAVDGIFIEIGSTPASIFIKALGVKMDEEGYIIADENQKTNIEGVFAAGDISTGSSKLKQMIVGASEGAIATHNAYLDQKAQN